MTLTELKQYEKYLKGQRVELAGQIDNFGVFILEGRDRVPIIRWLINNKAEECVWDLVKMNQKYGQ